jgi:hypothetical protein
LDSARNATGAILGSSSGRMRHIALGRGPRR